MDEIAREYKLGHTKIGDVLPAYFFGKEIQESGVSFCRRAVGQHAFKLIAHPELANDPVIGIGSYEEFARLEDGRWQRTV